MILTADPAKHDPFWLADYLPEVIVAEASRYPSPGRVGEILGGATVVTSVPIPLCCTDGLGEAYYGRPERFLDRGVQRAMSAWSLVPDHAIARFERRLTRDPADGGWDAR